MNETLWSHYAHWQSLLLSSRRMTDASWGFEDALDYLAEQLVKNAFTTPDDLELKLRRIVAAGASRERSRRAIRRRLTPNKRQRKALIWRQLAAKQRADAILATLPERDTKLLLGRAEGYRYSDLAAQLGRSAESLRVQFRRLCVSLRAKNA